MTTYINLVFENADLITIIVISIKNQTKGNECDNEKKA